MIIVMGEYLWGDGNVLKLVMATQHGNYTKKTQSNVYFKLMNFYVV